MNAYDSANTLSDIDFADKRRNPTTEISQEIHSQFDSILKFAHFDYDKKKISFSVEKPKNETEEDKKGKRRLSAYKSNQRREEAKRKVTKVIQVTRGEVCPVCGYKPLRPTEHVVQRTIIDLVLIKGGIKKTVTQYVGFQGYCVQCFENYSPPDIRRYERRQLYGHGLKVWIAYQRVAMRLPYSSIIETIEEHFGEKISKGRLPDFIQEIGNYYAEIEKSIVRSLLKSPYIHADETDISVQGTNQYVWVFTDGKYVVFRLSETRESSIVHEFLGDYAGVLISDFYPGYDSVKCRQQKCWVHLIRNLNDDLLENPFDTEYEAFVLAVKQLIIPIMESVQNCGLKRRYLNKFKKDVDNFYLKVITEKQYSSDLSIKYQKRFIRYRDSLFTFLEDDGIPWHNNTAERAIRPVTKQRAISRSFHASVMSNYLVLLGIRQACRFQGKSFFKFLFSGETDIEKFGTRKRK